MKYFLLLFLSLLLPVAAFSQAPTTPPMASMPQNESPVEARSVTNENGGPKHQGVRPKPDVRQFPANPFIGGSSLTSPTIFKSEFNILAKKIRGIIHIGDRVALVIGNYVVRQRESVQLNKIADAKEGDAKGGKKKTQEKEVKPLPAPTSAANKTLVVPVFSEIKKDQNAAVFLLGDTEISVPLPSMQKRLEDANGAIAKMNRLGTVTFLGGEGFFVTNTEVIPREASKQKLAVRTQAGTFPVAVIRNHETSHLTLCKTLIPISIQAIEWQDIVSEEESQILAFDPTDRQVLSRTRLWKLKEDANPSWLVGGLVFQSRLPVGVIGYKNNVLNTLTELDLVDMFPEVEKKESSAKEEKSAKNPDTANQVSRFSNPEKYVGLLYLYSE